MRSSHCSVWEVAPSTLTIVQAQLFQTDEVAPLELDPVGTVEEKIGTRDLLPSKNFLARAW